MYFSFQEFKKNKQKLALCVVQSLEQDLKKNDL